MISTMHGYAIVDTMTIIIMLIITTIVTINDKAL